MTRRCSGCAAVVERTERELARRDKVYCRTCLDARRPIPWECQRCGTQKTVSPSWAKRNRRCRGCRPVDKPMQWVWRTCDECDVPFFRRIPAGTTVRFCADACRLKWFARAFVGPDSPQWLGGQQANYGPHWDETRLAVLTRDGYRCRACGLGREDVDRLIAAHLIPRRSFSKVSQGPRASDSLINLVTLCTSCHISFDRAKATRWDSKRSDRLTWPDWAHNEGEQHAALQPPPDELGRDAAGR